MSGDTAAKKRTGCTDQTEVDEITHQVIHQDRCSADAERLVKENITSSRAEVVNEEIAADQIEARVREGKRERIGDQRSGAVSEMRFGTIKQGNVKPDSTRLHLFAHGAGHISGTGRNFEQGELIAAGSPCNLLDHLLRCADSPEAVVESAQV